MRRLNDIQFVHILFIWLSESFPDGEKTHHTFALAELAFDEIMNKLTNKLI